MMMIDYRKLLLMLTPTFLRVGVLRAICNAVAMTLQRCFNSMFDYSIFIQEKVKWTSERKSMRERLNLLFLNKSFDETDAKSCIRVEDGYDVDYFILYDNENFDTMAEAANESIILNDYESEGGEMVIVYDTEDVGMGCDLRVVVPIQQLQIINIVKMKNETYRLLFAGLLCLFFADDSDNNIIEI